LPQAVENGLATALTRNRCEVEMQSLMPLLKHSSKRNIRREGRTLYSAFSVSVNLLYITAKTAGIIWLF